MHFVIEGAAGLDLPIEAQAYLEFRLFSVLSRSNLNVFVVHRFHLPAPDRQGSCLRRASGPDAANFILKQTGFVLKRRARDRGVAAARWPRFRKASRPAGSVRRWPASCDDPWRGDGAGRGTARGRGIAGPVAAAPTAPSASPHRARRWMVVDGPERKEKPVRALKTLMLFVVIALAIPAAVIAGPIVAAIHVALHWAPGEGAAASPQRYTDPGVP
jgi:hypothetical protein